MAKLNLAQRWLVAIGVDDVRITLGAHNDLSERSTKKGPGRKHQDGVKRLKNPKTRAGLGFVQHTATAAKRLRRTLVRMEGGIRQFKKASRTTTLPAGLVD